MEPPVVDTSIEEDKGGFTSENGSAYGTNLVYLQFEKQDDIDIRATCWLNKKMMSQRGGLSIFLLFLFSWMVVLKYKLNFSIKVK
jgi:hypothetical protein